MNEPAAPPALHRLVSALLLSPPALDRLGYLVDAGAHAEGRLNGGAPSQRSLTLQALIADARREARVLSRDDIDSDLDVTPSRVMSTAQAAVVFEPVAKAAAAEGRGVRGQARLWDVGA